MSRVDRELSLELKECPVNPAFLHMLSPTSNSCDQLFHLEINGELLWQWRTHKLDPVLLFHALQENLSPAWLYLSSGSMVRVGQLLKNKVYFIVKKWTVLETEKYVDLCEETEYWARLAIHRDEILKVPADVNINHELHQTLVEGKIVITLHPVYYVCCIASLCNMKTLCHFKVVLKYFSWAPLFPLYFLGCPPSPLNSHFFHMPLLPPKIPPATPTS